MKSELPALIHNGEALEVFSVLGAGGSKTVLDVSVEPDSAGKYPDRVP